MIIQGLTEDMILMCWNWLWGLLRRRLILNIRCQRHVRCLSCRGEHLTDLRLWIRSVAIISSCSWCCRTLCQGCCITEKWWNCLSSCKCNWKRGFNTSHLCVWNSGRCQSLTKRWKIFCKSLLPILKIVKASLANCKNFQSPAMPRQHRLSFVYFGTDVDGWMCRCNHQKSNTLHMAAMLWWVNCKIVLMVLIK